MGFGHVLWRKHQCPTIKGPLLHWIFSMDFTGLKITHGSTVSFWSFISLLGNNTIYLPEIRGWDRTKTGLNDTGNPIDVCIWYSLCQCADSEEKQIVLKANTFATMMQFSCLRGTAMCPKTDISDYHKSPLYIYICVCVCSLGKILRGISMDRSRFQCIDTLLCGCRFHIFAISHTFRHFFCVEK